MATAAISSGSRAMKLAKTRANTSRAPSPPSRTSVRAVDPSPLLVSALSWVRPVTPVGQPEPWYGLGSGGEQPARLGHRRRPGRRARRNRRRQHDRRILVAAVVVEALDRAVGL